MDVKYHNSAAWNGTSYWERLKKETEPVQREPPPGKNSDIWSWIPVSVGQNLILLSPTFDPNIWKHSLTQTEGSFLFYFKCFTGENSKSSTVNYVGSEHCCLCTCSEFWNTECLCRKCMHCNLCSEQPQERDANLMNPEYCWIQVKVQINISKGMLKSRDMPIPLMFFRWSHFRGIGPGARNNNMFKHPAYQHKLNSFSLTCISDIHWNIKCDISHALHGSYFHCYVYYSFTRLFYELGRGITEFRLCIKTSNGLVLNKPVWATEDFLSI